VIGFDASLLGALLREPGEVSRRCVDERDLAPLAATSLGTIACGCAVFGAVVGCFRGGTQIPFAALKMPVARLAALAICGPAFHALAAVFGRPWSLRTVVALGLAAGARASLVLLALAPVLWLVIDRNGRYDAVKVCAALAYAFAGLAALWLVLRALGRGSGSTITAAGFVAVFLAVGGQTAWILRPYIGEPSDAVVPLFVSRQEGGVADALARSARAVVGVSERR